MNIQNALILSLLLLSASSCSTIKEPETVVATHIEQTESLETKSTQVSQIKQDSTGRMRQLMMSDPRVVLLNHIIIKDGRLIIDLSLEDAISIGISSELYKDYSRKIQDWNEK